MIGVREHNLQDVAVEIPHGRLTVVTGVSGSGKSSLVFDTLHAVSQRRYLETLSLHARRFLQSLPTPRCAEVHGISPSIALGQRRAGEHSRSTVGTISGLHDVLRFAFARVTGLEPREFSFVSAGACPDCRGIGGADEVSRDLLVADETKTLRQGALVPTTPNGYIVYSQVAVDAMDTVCKAHGFDVDTPWRDLSREQQDVIFLGSDRVEVPFGKHSLESRMRWEGITAKPRELGFYKGLIPTIEEILRRSRNENALRFAHTVPCRACSGTRLADRARAAKIDGVAITDVAAMPLPQLAEWCGTLGGDERVRLQRRLAIYDRLGLAHLTCERATSSLSGGELQRLRLGAMATGGMSGVTFVLDEPSIGLHASEEAAVLDLLRGLRDEGNTVVVVEHSEQALQAADHLIDLGPGPGVHGGQVLFEGPPALLGANADPRSQTRAHYSELGSEFGKPLRQRRAINERCYGRIVASGVNNLQQIDGRFAVGGLNVVSGVAGAGKSTLVARVLVPAVRAHIETRALPQCVQALHWPDGIAVVSQVIHVDQDPIGRTPRSNPATYTGVFDDIRKCFAAEPEAKERRLSASAFSFNTKGGGRCATCEGSGREVVGMHGMPQVELVCGECGGRRFRDDVLSVRLHGKFSVLDVLETTVEQARAIFAAHAKILAVLDALHLVGLGHLTLGQPATTLSGGEAQRVKLAGELARGGRKKALFVLEEPTIGLHRADVKLLLAALDGLVGDGHTVVLVEHDLDVLRAADHLIDLGPGAGQHGGRVVGQGTADEIARLDSPTGRALRGESVRGQAEHSRSRAVEVARPSCMRLRGVTTHNLRGIDVDLPSRGLTVVTGVSGSGKSSLVFDTLFGESRARFTEHLSGTVQRQLGSAGVRARSLAHANGLRPAIALAQQTESEVAGDRRSTVATTTEAHALLRTLWSRIGGTDLAAGAFSFFGREGACPMCRGTGSVLRCDPARVVANELAPLFGGALAEANKVVNDYVDRGKRYRALIESVARARGIDLACGFDTLDADARRVILHGCGEQEFEAEWQHGGAEAGDVHQWRSTWLGICGDIDREYARRQASGSKGRAKDFAALLAERPCDECGGSRLAEPMRSVAVAERTLHQACELSVDALRQELQEGWPLREHDQRVAEDTLEELQRRLQSLADLGLGHLQLHRSTATLSAGERQRLRLARQLAAPLTGCVYVLDEPTLGLHAQDTQALLAALRSLVVAGNAVVVVEHDMQVVAAGGHVVEIGPGAGAAGGQVVASGPPNALAPESRTGRWLRAPKLGLRSQPRRAPMRFVEVCGASLHHLKDLDVAFPVGCLTVVSGVSGSGKTSLARGVLAASAVAGEARGCREVRGLQAFSAVVEDAGARASRSRQSCIATLLGIFDELRKQFAATELARERGWRAGHFAFLGKSGGACKNCSGLGWLRSEFDFLGADSWLVCDECSGRRFDAATLEVRWHGLSIADVLAMSAEQVLEIVRSAETPKLEAPLAMMQELGLSYLQLGQSGDSLSGGEAQRLALATHLCRKAKGVTLFVLDEPTRGLHPDDVVAMLAAFERLLAAGHTIVAIEHDLAVIAAADHVVDLGPATGADGGSLVAACTPVELARLDASATGRALASAASKA